MSKTLDELMALADDVADCAYNTACNNDFGDGTPAALVALRTRLAAIVEDAERYAFLHDDPPLTFAVRRFPGETERGCYLDGFNLDFEIDALRNQTKEPQ